MTPYSGVVAPLNPDGTTITTNIGSWIQKSAEANGTLVAAQAVSVSATQDVVQWYAINVGSGSPSLAQQGRVGGGNNTYAVYPGIDINPAGQIGMSYMQMGTDTATDYESMWVAVRVPADAAGTMEPPVLVPAGTGTQDNADGRAGDLSGINVDPVDGSFWAVNETANAVEPASPYGATINWGTTIANFNPGIPAGETDVAVTASGPSALSAGDTVTYTITLTNNGPIAAQNVVLTDALPAGATLVSFNQTAGTDGFTLSQSGGTVTQTANGPLAVGSSDTFSLVVTADPNTAPGANFSDAASITGSTYDFNPNNNSATVAGEVFGPPADLVVSTSTPTTVIEGNSITYTVTVTNNGPNPATDVVLTDTRSNLRHVSATATQGTVVWSGWDYVDTIGSLAVGASVTMTITALANEDTGLGHSVTVTATSADPSPGNNTAAAGVAGSEPPIVVSGPIKTTAKSLSNFTVATFTHANAIEGTGAFSATINWGDGTTSAGTITLSGTTYSVVGSHIYKGGNSKTITTTVTEVGNAGALQGITVGGDDGVDLPPYLGGDPGWQRSLNAQTNQATHVVSDYLAGKATLQDVTSSLTALFARAKAENVAPDLSGLYELLRTAEATNPRALDVLNLLDDLWAAFGG